MAMKWYPSRRKKRLSHREYLEDTPDGIIQVKEIPTYDTEDKLKRSMRPVLKELINLSCKYSPETVKKAIAKSIYLNSKEKDKTLERVSKVHSGELKSMFDNP